MIKMSFKYGQFGEGFDVAYPNPAAMRFEEAVETRGRTLTIIEQTETGEDQYGQPVYSEKEYDFKAFVDAEASERVLPLGELKVGRVRAFLVPWAPVAEEGYEVELGGVRYHVAGVTETDVNLVLELERKAG